MAYTSIYKLNNFPSDKIEVVMNRIKQNPKMKLITVAQDYDLHDKLARWGVKDNQSLNMYDWLQGAVDYGNHDRDYDFRVLPRYDKRELIMAPVTRGDSNYLDLKHSGHRFARLDWQPGHIDRTKTQTLYTNDQNVWAKDFYDTRGFLSRRKYYRPDGKVGMEIVFHVDGTPVLEISHMKQTQEVKDETGKVKKVRRPVEMYRLLGTHGLPNWLLANELSLMLWWQGEMLKGTTVKQNVYNDEPALDPVWTQLTTKVNLIEVAHATDLTQQRVNELQNRRKVVAVSRPLSRAYNYQYLEPWKKQSVVHQKHKYDHNKVAGVGRWLTNDQARDLISIINHIHENNRDTHVDLFGYFTTDSQKYFKKQMKKLKLTDVVTIRGNVVGKVRAEGIQQSAVAFYQAQLTDSDVLPHLINHFGVPVVTNVAGVRGAFVNAPVGNQQKKTKHQRIKSLPELFAEGVIMGLKYQRKWRKDVKQNAD